MLVCTRSSRLSSISHVGNRRSVSRSATVAFEASERGADAEVGAVPEREVAVDVAAHVEAVGIREVALVAVGGAVEQRHLRAALRRPLPCSSMSRATHRDCMGDGAS